MPSSARCCGAARRHDRGRAHRGGAGSRGQSRHWPAARGVQPGGLGSGRPRPGLEPGAVQARVPGQLAQADGPRPAPEALACCAVPGMASLAWIVPCAAGRPGWVLCLPRARLLRWQRAGIRLLCPGDPGWPGQLDVLGDAQPWALWVRGTADLRFACLRSVSVVGTRAATPYGEHVAAIAGRRPGRARLVRGVRRCARHRRPCAPRRARRRRHHDRRAALRGGRPVPARAPRPVRGHGRARRCW